MKRLLAFLFVAGLTASEAANAWHNEYIEWKDPDGFKHERVVRVSDKHDNDSIDTTKTSPETEAEIAKMKREEEARHQENRNRFSYDGKIGHETVYYNPVLKQHMYVNQDTGVTRFENAP